MLAGRFMRTCASDASKRLTAKAFPVAFRSRTGKARAHALSEAGASRYLKSCWPPRLLLIVKIEQHFSHHVIFFISKSHRIWLYFFIHNILILLMLKHLISFVQCYYALSIWQFGFGRRRHSISRFYLIALRNERDLTEAILVVFHT